MTDKRYLNNILEYNKNPVICKYCGKQILADGSILLNQVKKKKFCNQYCFKKSKQKLYNKSGIYKIENLINGKIYIGQSKNIHNRWVDHKYHLENGRHVNKHLQSSWNKYGNDNFQFSIIEECEINILDEREVFWINELKTTIRENGYNLTFGGDGGKGAFEMFDEDKKERIRNAVKKARSKPVYQYDKDGNFIKKYNSTSDAVRENTSYCHSSILKVCNKEYGLYREFQWRFYYKEFIGINYKIYVDKQKSEKKPFKRSYEKKVFVYDKECNLIKTFKSVKDASVYYGTNPQTISACCLKKSKTHKGYVMSYEELTIDSLNLILRNGRLNRNGKVRAIKQFTIDGVEIMDFDSIREAAKYYEINEKYICSCCTGGQHTYNGYIWKYA